MCRLSAHDGRAGRQKAQFICTLICGWVLSVFWFIIHLELTSHTKIDTEVINHAGRLRYLTQHVGLVVFAGETLADTQSQQEPGDANNSDLSSALSQIEAICSGLLRQEIDTGDDPAWTWWHQGRETSAFEYPPEINDEVVKDALREWVSGKFIPLQRAIGHTMTLRTSTDATLAQDRAALSEVLLRVNEGTMAVDKVVNLASTEAKERVHTLFVASVTRAALGLVWALVTAVAFGRVWKPYITTYNKLQEVERQLDSLLRGAFDLVVPVSAIPPFNVLDKMSELGHFLGRDLPEASILSSAGDAEEAQKLSDILANASRAAMSDSVSTYWWQMVPMKQPAQNPVAPMIQTRWACGPPGQEQRSLKVEVFVVSIPRGEGRHMSTLLAVRRSSDDPSGQHADVDAALGLTRVAVEASVSAMMGTGAMDALRAALPAMNHLPMSDSSISGDQVLRSLHGSSSAETNTDALPIGGNGVFTPRSELDGTPPPTIFGRGTSNTTRAEARAMVNVTDFAMQIQSALEQQGSVSGSETPPL